MPCQSPRSFLGCFWRPLCRPAPSYSTLGPPASFLSRLSACPLGLSPLRFCPSVCGSFACDPLSSGGDGGGPLEVPPPLTPPLPLPQSTGSSRWQCGAAARVSRARMTAAWTFTEFWPSSSCSNAPRTAATPNSTSRRERSTPQVGGGGALGSGGGATPRPSHWGDPKPAAGERGPGWGRGHAAAGGASSRPTSWGGAPGAELREVGGACVGAGLGAEQRVRPGLWADLCSQNPLDRFPPTCSPRRQ